MVQLAQARRVSVAWSLRVKGLTQTEMERSLRSVLLRGVTQVAQDW